MYFCTCVNGFIFKNKIWSRRNSICEDPETRKNLVHSELKEGQCAWNTETKKQNSLRLKAGAVGEECRDSIMLLEVILKSLDFKFSGQPLKDTKEWNNRI